MSAAMTEMQKVQLAEAGDIVRQLAAVIVENRAYLSEIDGAIGDGDHGVNMSKGFALAAETIGDGTIALSPALQTLGATLLEKIGGSMGPLYGSFFLDMAETIDGKDFLDAAGFEAMLAAGIATIADLGGARPGDKTLMDTLVPALAAFRQAREKGATFGACLAALVAAAEQGKESTRDLVARIGRASRLGERSRGVLDAGAASSFLILRTMAEGLTVRLQAETNIEAVK